jgi:hypothetical protein
MGKWTMACSDNSQTWEIYEVSKGQKKNPPSAFCFFYNSASTQSLVAVCAAQHAMRWGLWGLIIHFGAVVVADLA